MPQREVSHKLHSYTFSSKHSNHFWSKCHRHDTQSCHKYNKYSLYFYALFITRCYGFINIRRKGIIDSTCNQYHNGRYCICNTIIGCLRVTNHLSYHHTIRLAKNVIGKVMRYQRQVKRQGVFPVFFVVNAFSSKEN